MNYHNSELEGETISYHPDQSVDYIGNYRNGSREGFWEGFYSFGGKSFTYHYENDLEEGLQINYRLSGCPGYMGVMKNGVKDGMWIWCDERGRITKSEVWNMGEMVTHNQIRV
jgi:antitoxin component YwqK of YwqJK toxin-antitoxin module